MLQFFWIKFELRQYMNIIYLMRKTGFNRIKVIGKLTKGLLMIIIQKTCFKIKELIIFLKELYYLGTYFVIITK